MRPILTSRSAALAAVALAFTFATPVCAEDKPMDRLITVSASGYAAAEPDRVRLSTGVTAEAGTAATALAANTKIMTEVVEGLKAAGIDAKDIQTSNINVEPRYTQPRDGTTAVIDGYRVSNQVEILVRDLGKLGELLDKLVTLGANTMNGLTFEVSKAETLKDEARKEAVANALRRARLLAAAAGAEVGDVVNIAEETSYGGPRPMAMARAAKAEVVPIEAGTETLEARVTVTWKLK
jgi:uncharacterized protein YggE